MPLEKATAIVLRTTDWSESSLVVTLFTRESGKVRAVAKGARRPKSAFESALDVLSSCRIVFLRKSSDALDILAEAKLMERFRPLERGLQALHAGYYIAELLDALTDDYDPHERVFDHALATLAAMSPDAPMRAQVLHFELAALRHFGYSPALDECVDCGQAVAPRGRVPFSDEAGGVLCPRCRPGKRNVVALSERAWRTLRDLAFDTQFEAGGRVTVPVDRLRDLPAETLGELRPVVNRYVNSLLGFAPKTQAGLGG